MGLVGLPGPPWAAVAHLLVGTLFCSGKCRAVFCESEDQAHLVWAIDAGLRRLGGTARRWRFDRVATVCDPGSGRLHASFASVARYYGVAVDICPARRANRKGVVESANHFIAQRFWRTTQFADMADARAKLDRFLQTIGDERWREGVSVGEAARAEHRIGLPAAPYPATIGVTRRVGASALISYLGNRYSLPPGLEGAQVGVRHRLGDGGLGVPAPASRGGGGALPSRQPQIPERIDHPHHQPRHRLLGPDLRRPDVAVAMLDRLFHRSTVIAIDGESYRMRSHRAQVEALRAGVAGGH